MRILLIDIDSKIPNLALMKISAYHKQKGDDIYLNYPLCKPDTVYASCIFPDNYEKLKVLPFDNIEIGGTGSKSTKSLPDNIEHIMPDYSLYPNYDHAMGYTYRYCPRKCPFCVVPEYEKDLSHRSIYEFWNGQKEIMIMNNN